ncbi:exosome complex component RRP43-like isoform X2 [Pseudomyrmex gracilis]|uniref:exosome complex component RRP43-like isoform X2 n=1 Tax=Pseudomyrmex gracilis TaxID=219809 RepID=UPI0009959085|nr:exosome complex component RRP43-like isoform X2 [Pseudomyrmex gracilis]
MDLQYKTIHPSKYLQDHLDQEIRPDGRKFLSFRPVSVNVSSIVQADGSAIFKLGDTTAVCGIKAELATPKSDTPDNGYVVANVDLSPLCSSKFRPGPPSEQAQMPAPERYSRLSKHIFAVTLPEVNYSSETGVIVVQPKNRKPFTVRTIPVSTSFALFENPLLIADPTDDEEELSSGKFSIVMDDDEQICYINKPGGIPISQNLLSKGIELAKTRSKLVRSVIEAAISTLRVNSIETDT